MTSWMPFPYDPTDYHYSEAELKKHWSRLHLGDAEPAPKDKNLLSAWQAFHASQFEQAVKLGLRLLEQVVERALEYRAADPMAGNALVMLEGDKRMKEAEKLYAQTAQCTPLDAMEKLDVELAHSEWED